MSNNNQSTTAINAPIDVIKANIKLQENRAKMPPLKTILLGIMAGFFIAGGAAASSVAMHAISNLGLARFAGGAIFPVGLMMIVFIGGELFTGDCMMVFGIFTNKVKISDLIRVLIVVWLSNCIGSIFFAYLIFASGQFNYTDGLLGAFTIKVALGKSTMSFGSAFASGILCNIFVCGAVLMGSAAKEAGGKVWAIFFPIMTFVVSGYEHCVANMYYIPAGIFAKSNAKYVQVAMDTYGYTTKQLEELNWGSLLIKSSLPVTLGNMVGGMIFISLLLFLIHKPSLNEQ